MPREQPGTAGSDAERRSARDLAVALQAAGREARTVPLWVRTAWWLALAACALAGVVAALISVEHPLAGLLAAVVALALALAELSPVPLLRRLTIARATQNVLSPPRAPAQAGHEAQVTLVVTCAVDRPPSTLARRLGWPLPQLTVIALAGVAACAGARLAGADGTLIGVVQLVPALLALVTGAALLEEGVAQPCDDEPATAAALALAAALDRDPPLELDVAIVLAGAGGARSAGLRQWLRSRRKRGLSRTAVAIVHLEPAPSARWWDRDGTVLRSALQPQLRTAALAAAAAQQEPVPAMRRLDAGAAGLARSAGWPALAVGVHDGDIAFALSVVRELDRVLAAAAG